MFGAGGAAGDKANSADDEEDAGPAVEAEVLVQSEAAEEGDDNVSECSGGHDEGEVGPGESDHIAGKESDEQHDAGDDVRVRQGVEEKAEVVEIDGADLRHAAGEEGVADGCSEHDGEEDG